MVTQYLLDTNAWIHYLKDPASSIRARLATISPRYVVTCSVVLSELLILKCVTADITEEEA
jgi:predicted nucleic acid-binding protein